MSERVRHAMLVVREASSFVPEIGTTDTSDKQRSTECSLKWHEQRTRVACETYAGRFSSFLRSKRTWRKACKRIYNKSIKVKNCGGILTPSATSLLSSLVPLRQGDNSKAGRPCPYGKSLQREPTMNKKSAEAWRLPRIISLKDFY